jgi:hypothetical protein
MKILIGLASLSLAATGFAQTTSNGMDGWGAESTYNKLYSSKSEVTVKGRITGIADESIPSQSMTAAETVLVKSANGGVTTVDLGPKWYLTNMKPGVKLNDQVSVTGSKVVLNNRSFVIARKIADGKRVLYLREVSGFPLWVAGRPVRAGITGSRRSTTVATNATASHDDIDVGPIVDAQMVPVPQPAPPNASKNPADQTMRTVNGTVQQVMTVPGPNGVPENVLMVQTPQGVVTVDLGPEWYIQHQNLGLTAGNPVSLNAAPPPYLTVPGMNNVLLANDLSYGSQYYVFRGGNLGQPFWSPWIGN